MAESASAGSPAPLETTEQPAQASKQDDSGVTPEQWAAMRRITEKVYAHREKEYVAPYTMSRI